MTKHTHSSQIEHVQLNIQISTYMKKGWDKVYSKLMLDIAFVTLCSLVYLKSESLPQQQLDFSYA